MSPIVFGHDGMFFRQHRYVVEFAAADVLEPFGVGVIDAAIQFMADLATLQAFRTHLGERILDISIGVGTCNMISVCIASADNIATLCIATDRSCSGS